MVLPPHLDLLNRKLCRVAAGSIRRLLITMPPRHGKSHMCSQYFPAWYLGTFPDRRVILTSYEADFAMTWGRKVRDLLQEHGRKFFNVGVRSDSTAANRWSIAGTAGGMDTAGVGGPITGKGADLLIIDDPVKNAEEAASETFRNRTWEWFTSTAYTRLEPSAAILLIQTRWHADDLAGRILARAGTGDGEHWDVVNLPALAHEGDILGRKPGDALWPERFGVEELAVIRRELGAYFFSALYDQNPTPLGGGMFKREWFRVVEAAPVHALQRVRYWDFASSLQGDYTVGVRMARTHDGLYYVEDVTRGRWSPMDRDRVVLQCAQGDGKAVHVVVEQEPGSSGVSVVDATVRMLAGYVIHGERATGDKVTRAQPFAAQCEAGNVRLVNGPWVGAFLDELTSFPMGKHDDQVDSASAAFNRLASTPAPGGYASGPRITPAVGFATAPRFGGRR